MVTYLLVTPYAFWMSASKPASVNAFCSGGRSPFSQRGDDAESGRMTQARVALLEPPVLPDAQPVSSNADAATATTIDSGGERIPANLVKTVVITRDNIKDTVVKAKYVDVAALCKGDYANVCKSLGITP